MKFLEQISDNKMRVIMIISKIQFNYQSLKTKSFTKTLREKGISKEAIGNIQLAISLNKVQRLLISGVKSQEDLKLFNQIIASLDKEDLKLTPLSKKAFSCVTFQLKPGCLNIVFKPKKYYEYYDDVYRWAYQAGMNSWLVDRHDGKSMKSFETDLKEILNLELLPPLPAKAIDLGCGEGQYTILFAKMGYEMTGIDISQSAIKRARMLSKEAGVKINFQTGDITDLSRFKNSSFDLALQLHSFHVLINPKDRQAHLSEVFRILKPGGILFFNNGLTPTSEFQQEEMAKERQIGELIKGRIAFRGRKIEFKGPYTRMLYVSQEEYEREITQAGFDILKSFVRKDTSSSPKAVDDLVVYARKA
jgi:ubiquinone/menaquinone biosynthesis C-methylase UbiE